jgi:hypothetical protein
MTGNRRISRLGDLERYDGDHTPSQKTANELIAAERALAEAQDNYLAAKRAWTDSIKGRPDAFGHVPDPTKTQVAYEAAEAIRDGAGTRIEQLRLQLHEQRRRELLLGTVASQETAHRRALQRLNAATRRPRSLWDRLFRRG